MCMLTKCDLYSESFTDYLLQLIVALEDVSCIDIL